MKQLTYYISNKLILESTLYTIKNTREYEEANSILALMYTNGLTDEESKGFSNYIKQTLSKAMVAGVSVVTSNNFKNEKGFSLSVLFFDSSSVSFLEFDGDDYTDDDVMKSLNEELVDKSDVKTVLCYPVGSNCDFTKILSETSNKYNNIAFFGLMAGSRKCAPVEKRGDFLFS